MNDRDSDGENPNIVIVAEHNERHRIQIESILLEAGLQHLIFVEEGNEIFQTLRQYQRNLDQIGLLILSEGFPGCDTNELCDTIAAVDGGIGIPVVVLSERGGQYASGCNSLPTSAVSILTKPVRCTDFLPLVGLSLLLRKERALRFRQEEQLLSELSERKIMEARLKYLVTHDELTGLANRRSLEKAIRVAMYRNRLLNQCSALIYLDLDRFNLVNDLEGHETGDRLLVEVVNLLHLSVRMDHVTARIGADEFCIFLQQADRDETLRIAETLRRKFDEFRFATSNDCYHVTASLGIALLDIESRFSHPSELISQGHQACGIAKSNGRNAIYLYNPRDDHLIRTQKDISWVPLIREALADNRLFLVFQPVVRLADETVTHYEALIRMRTRNNEVLKPTEFVPVAERMGLIRKIDVWVLENAIDFLASLPDRQAQVSLNINLSAAAFQDTELLPMLQQKLELTWVAAHRLTFEITETTAVSNLEQTREMIQRMRGLGCQFALDDFGSGFSSFDYLKKFPVDYLKIDGQFVQNLLYDETDQVLVKAVIDIAKKLGKRTIAEYVEHPRVLSILRSFGVDYVQGYLLGEPSADLIGAGRISLPQDPHPHQPPARIGSKVD